MPSLNCVACGGEGMTFVLYCNHAKRKLYKRLISCQRCNKCGDLKTEQKEGEEILDATIDVQSLLNNGYEYNKV